MRPWRYPTPPGRRALLAFFTLTVGVGCSRPAPPSDSTHTPDAALRTLPVTGAQGASAVEVPAAAVGASDGGSEGEPPYVLTPERLERFIGYQQRMLGLYSELLKAGGGKARKLEDPERLARWAAAEAAARQELQLSESDVREIERIVGDVLARRTVARTMNPEAALEQLRALREKLGPEQQARLDETLEEMTEHQEVASRLAEERSRYGDANVDVVLARESELARLWDERMAVFLGRPIASEQKP